MSGDNSLTMEYDHGRKGAAFQAFLNSSDEHLTMKRFIDQHFPDVLASMLTPEIDTLKCLGIGCGEGQPDRQMVRQMIKVFKHVDYLATEPSSNLISTFKECVKAERDLDAAAFSFDATTADEFLNSNPGNKYHFITMSQMLFYVNDFRKCIRSYYDLLEDGGVLFIIHLSGTSGWQKLWWEKLLPTVLKGTETDLTTGKEIEDELKSGSYNYSKTTRESLINFEEVFKESDAGFLLLDFVSNVENSDTAFSGNERVELLEYIKEKCCRVVNGKIYFDNSQDYFIVRK